MVYKTISQFKQIRNRVQTPSFVSLMRRVASGIKEKTRHEEENKQEGMCDGGRVKGGGGDGGL